MRRAYRMSEMPPSVYTEPVLYRRLTEDQNHLVREVSRIESAARDRKRRCLTRAAVFGLAGIAGFFLDGLPWPLFLGFLIWWGSAASIAGAACYLLEANIARIEVEGLQNPDSLTNL